MLAITPNLHQLNNCALQLINKNLTIALAESGTAGSIYAAFAQARDAIKFLKAGTRCDDAKTLKQLLKGNTVLIADCTQVTAEVSEPITRGLQQLHNADLSIVCLGQTLPRGLRPKKNQL